MIRKSPGRSDPPRGLLDHVLKERAGNIAGKHQRRSSPQATSLDSRIVPSARRLVMPPNAAVAYADCNAATLVRS